MNDGSVAHALYEPPLSSSAASESSSVADGSETRLEDGRLSISEFARPEETSEFKAWSKQHAKLLDLLAAYDSMVYMELAALYYMDTSTVLVILRTLLHLTQISHARALAIARAPSSLNLKPTPMNVLVVLFINSVALLLHIFMNPAAADEETRGYLHGHLIIDLIGQKAVEGWLGKAKLCVMDLLVCLLQVVAVGVVTESEKVERTMEQAKRRQGDASSTRSRQNEDSGENQSAHLQSSSMHLFAFRRNWQRRQRANTDEDVGIELQDLPPSGTSSWFTRNGSASRTEDVENQDASTSEAGIAGAGDQSDIVEIQSSSQVIETIASGQVVLVHLRISDLFRNHFWQWRNRRLSGTV